MGMKIQQADEPVDTQGAPPKQVAQALEQLGQAGRLIADVRIGTDRLLEALMLLVEEPHTRHVDMCLNLIIKEDALMNGYFNDLRALGKQLEESGVLTESLRLRSNTWGLHMPLVCPDGAVVAYAWKRQLAGQAGASAVDRTRLALKAFKDQKRQFFPHLDDSSVSEPLVKKHCSQLPLPHEDRGDPKTLPEMFSHLEKEVSNLQVYGHERLHWLNRASTMSSSLNEGSLVSSKDPGFPSTRKWTEGSVAMPVSDKAAVVELLLPSVFRAVVSLHTAGSMDPDAVAFFSPDEVGSYIHARGVSSHHVFRHISEHASMALQYFNCAKPESALLYLLHWICSYETLFMKVCSKCDRLLSMDKQTGLLLPPVKRPFRRFAPFRSSSNPSLNSFKAFHIGCFSEDA